MKATRMNADREPSGRRFVAERFALVNGRIVLPTTIVTDQVLLVERGLILGLTERSQLDDATVQIDVGGRLISPGLIDIHIHGAQGHTFNEPTAEAFAAITREKQIKNWRRAWKLGLIEASNPDWRDLYGDVV